MKATELQIGDLVWLSDDICIKVEQITKNKVGYHAKSNESKMHYARLCDIEPIPITSEILIKNGIEKCEDSILYDWRHSRLQNGAISCFKDPNKNWDFDILGKHLCPRKFRGDLKYVHELQHALRLCEIDKEIKLS